MENKIFVTYYYNVNGHIKTGPLIRAKSFFAAKMKSIFLSFRLSKQIKVIGVLVRSTDKDGRVVYGEGKV